jgi:hypothetical protein
VGVVPSWHAADDELQTTSSFIEASDVSRDQDGGHGLSMGPYRSFASFHILTLIMRLSESVNKCRAEGLFLLGPILA